MRERILAVLERNARIDVHELVMLLSESEAAVVNETVDMEKENMIHGYHTLVDWESTSNERVEALIEVSVTPQCGMGYDRIVERVYQYNEVDSVYLMSGAFDSMVLLKDKIMWEVALSVSERLAPLESVTGTSTHLVLKKYKDHDTEMEVKKEGEGQLFMA